MLVFNKSFVYQIMLQYVEDIFPKVKVKSNLPTGLKYPHNQMIAVLSSQEQQVLGFFSISLNLILVSEMETEVVTMTTLRYSPIVEIDKI